MPDVQKTITYFLINEYLPKDLSLHPQANELTAKTQGGSPSLFTSCPYTAYPKPSVGSPAACYSMLFQNCNLYYSPNPPFLAV